MSGQYLYGSPSIYNISMLIGLNQIVFGAFGGMTLLKFWLCEFPVELYTRGLPWLLELGQISHIIIQIHP